MALAISAPDEILPPAELAERLVAVRLLSSDHVPTILANFHADCGEETGNAFLKYLEKRGEITPFQVGRVAAGEWDRLSQGPYVLSAAIGTGTLGPVYRATNRDTNRECALQVLPLRSIWHVHLAKKLVRQFAEIPPHDGVVPLIDLDTSKGAHYLAWPFEDGEPLDRILARGGPLPVGEAVRLAVSVAEALAFAHRNGIVHGCLSPWSVLLSNDGRVRVLEWGVGAILAENLADDGSFLDTISSATAASQHLEYVPPETIADPSVRTFAGDQYSFGCLLYAAFTGLPPFPDGNLVDTMIAHQTRIPERVRARNSRVPEAVSAVVARLLCKTPAHRYADWIEPLAILRAASIGITSSPPQTADPVNADAPTATHTDTVPAKEFLAHIPDPLSARPSSASARGEHPESEVTFEIADGEADTDNEFGVNAGRPRAGSTGELPPIESKSHSATSLTPPSVRPIILRGRTSTPILSIDQSESPESADPPKVKGKKKVKFNFRLPSPVALGELKAGAEGEEVSVPTEPPRHHAGVWGWLNSKLFGAPIPEVMQVSVFGPTRVAAGQSLRLQAFAHPPVTFQSMRTLARAFVPDAELLASGYADRLVLRGAALSFHLAVANAGVGEPLVTFAWTGQPLPQTFEVHVPWESRTGVTSAVLSVNVGEHRTAVLPFRLSVLTRAIKVGSEKMPIRK